jgi:hypothetical protein
MEGKVKNETILDTMHLFLLHTNCVYEDNKEIRM